MCLRVFFIIFQCTVPFWLNVVFFVVASSSCNRPAIPVSGRVFALRGSSGLATFLRLIFAILLCRFPVVLALPGSSGAVMDKGCDCRGCGRQYCGVYGGRNICENPRRMRGWAFHSGMCTSCYCCHCHAAGQPCSHLCPTQNNARQVHAASTRPPATTLPPPPPGLIHHPMPQSVHPTAASFHQPQPQPQIQQPPYGQQQHIGHQVLQPAPPANSDGISPWAAASAQATQLAIAAVPHESAAAPVHAGGNETAVAEPTITSLALFAAAMETRLKIDEQELTRTYSGYSPPHLRLERPPRMGPQVDYDEEEC